MTLPIVDYLLSSWRSAQLGGQRLKDGLILLDPRRGLQRGDLIQKVDRRPVESLEDFEKALSKAEPGGTVLLLVRRNRSTRFVGLRVPEE